MTAQLKKAVEERIVIDQASGCWNWSLAVDKDGYGKLKNAGRTTRAHRASWISVNGEIPAGMLVCHKCDNPRCVNPAHLFLGSPKDNMDDKVKKGRWRGGPACWRPGSLGEGHHKARLNAEKVSQMRVLLKDRGIAEVAKLFDVSAGAVYAVKTRKTWANVAGVVQ